MNIVAIGEVLWDAFPSGERLGGAPFNFSAHAARLGHHVAFISGVGSDERGVRVLREMARLSVSSRYVRKAFDSPTGVVTVELSPAGEPAYVIHRPAAYDFPVLDAADLAELRALKPDWFYYGTLAQISPVVQAVTEAALGAVPDAQRFYDVNLRPGSDDPELVAQLLRTAGFVKLNEHEMARLASVFGLPAGTQEVFCQAFCEKFALNGICITLGPAGCLLYMQDQFARCPGHAVRVHDTVGAGDAFAAALVHGMSSGWALEKTGDFANRVGALVASRPGAIPEWTIADVFGRGVSL